MENLKERILVTGGAGYIGSVMVPILLAEGYRVTVLDLFRHGVPSLAALCGHPHLSLIRGDARQSGLIQELAPRHDAFIPLAAIVGAPACDQDEVAAVSTNLEAVRALLAALSPQQRVLFPVTNSGYGVGEKGAHCDENSPLRPLTLYGRTKIEAEALALAHGATISFRMATVFGVSPRMRLDLLVNDMVSRAVRDRFVVLFEAHFRRNYIHVRDVARAFVHGLANFDSMAGRPYNVGIDDANLTKWELCQKIRAAVPEFTVLEAEVGQDPDKRDYFVSNARLLATGFRPQYSLEDGIREVIDFCRMTPKFPFGNV